MRLKALLTLHKEFFAKVDKTKYFRGLKQDINFRACFQI